MASRWILHLRTGRAGSSAGGTSVDAPVTPGRGSVWVCAGLAVLVSVATLLLRGRLAFYIARSSYDDLHFVKQAAFLGRGAWLGPYDRLTLAKGPSYPAFIALVYRLGLDLKVAEQLTMLAAAAMVALSVWLVTHRLWLVTAVYLVLALNPISFTVGSAGVLRDGWYASLCILFPATVFVAVYGAFSRVAWGWWLASALLGGVSGAAMLLCREEGPASLPPAIVVVVALPVVLMVSRTRGTPERRRRWWRGMMRNWQAMVAVAVVGAATLGPIVFVLAENHSHYGVALTNDTANGTFVTAYSEWSRVRAGRDPSTASATIPIGKAERKAVYLISPAARELEPVLENPKNPWVRCGPGGCDLPGAFTIWAIRDAANAAGHFSDASAAQAYFGALASQIQQGCSSGVLTCSRQLPGPLQPLTQASAGMLWKTSLRMFQATLWSHYFTTPVLQKAVPPQAFQEYSAVAHDIPADATANAARNATAQRWHWVFTALFWVYRVLIPVLVVLGAVGLALGLVRPRRPRSTLTVFTAAMVVGLLLRIVTLALVQITQFSTSEARYQATTQVFLVTAAVVGTAFLADNLLRRARPGPTDDAAIPASGPRPGNPPGGDGETVPLLTDVPTAPGSPLTAG